MIKNGFLNELQNSIQRDINLEGMSQYLLLISAEDIIFSFDLMVIQLLNGTFHELDPLDHTEALNMALELLKKHTDKDISNVEIHDGMIKVRPLIVNKTGSNSGFFLLAKTKPGFILKPVYDKYLKHISVAKLTYDIFINPNASGLLGTDSNFLVYDDSDDLSISVLKEFTRMFHTKKLIAKSKLPDYIFREVNSRETVVDFITNDLDYTLNTFKDIMLKRFEEEIEKKNITSNKAVSNFQTMSVIGNVTAYNMLTMSKFTDENKPEFNVGLTYLFDSNLTRN